MKLNQPTLSLWKSFSSSLCALARVRVSLCFNNLFAIQDRWWHLAPYQHNMQACVHIDTQVLVVRVVLEFLFPLGWFFIFLLCLFLCLSWFCPVICSCPRCCFRLPKDVVTRLLFCRRQASLLCLCLPTLTRPVGVGLVSLLNQITSFNKCSK